MTATKMLQFSKETILQISEELMSYYSNTQPIYQSCSLFGFCLSQFFCLFVISMFVSLCMQGGAL